MDNVHACIQEIYMCISSDVINLVHYRNKFMFVQVYILKNQKVLDYCSTKDPN